MNYVLVHLQRKPDLTQQQASTVELKQEIDNQFKDLIAIVISSSIMLFILIWALILRFTKKITYPINQLTSLTEEIKRATGRDNREVVLNKIESHEIFQETKE